MPAKYDPAKALPLRVPPDVRKRLDALVDQVPPALRLPRNSVALAALVRGLEQLGTELARDPMAVHRALAGEGASPPSTGNASTALPSSPGARSERPPHARRATPERGPAPVEGGDAIDAAALLKRWKRSGLAVLTFCKAHGVTRSALQAWVGGRPAKPSTLAKIAAGLDAEGK